MALVTTTRDKANDERDKLVLANLEFVRHVYDRTVVELPFGIDDENLLSAGTLGLIQAAGSFDAARGVPFRSFAYWRIRGAIIDELRRNCPLPQRVLENLSLIRSAISELPVPIDFDVVSDVTGLSPTEVNECLQASRLASPRRWSGSATEKTAHRQDTPDSKMERVEVREKLASALGRLPDRERLTITLYYMEGLRLREIGAVLELSESRVCRILAKAEFNLKETLRLAGVTEPTDRLF